MFWISKIQPILGVEVLWYQNCLTCGSQKEVQKKLKSRKEADLEKQIVENTIEIASAFDKLLEKYELHKALRISIWVNIHKKLLSF